MPKVLGRRLLIRPGEREKTFGSLVIPETAQRASQFGYIEAVGDQDPEIDYTFLPGQKVLFSKYAGHEVELDGVDMLVISQSDILLVLPGEG